MENKSKWELFKEGTQQPATISQATMSCYVGMMLGAFTAAYKFFTNENTGLGIFFIFLGLLQLISLISEHGKYKGLKAMEKELREEELKQKRLE